MLSDFFKRVHKGLGLVFLPLLLCGGGNAFGQDEACLSELPADSLIDLARANYFTKGDYTLQIVDALYKKASSESDPDLFVQAVFWESLVAYCQYNRSIMANRIDSLLRLPLYTKNPRNELLLSYALAMNQLSKGRFPEAFRHTLNAYRLAVQLKDTAFVVQTATTIGNIAPYMQDYEMSRHYYRIAQAYCNDEVQSARIMMNLSRLQYIEEHYDSAMAMQHQSLAVFQRLRDSGNLVVAYLNIGSYLTALGERDSAYRTYLKALSIAERMDNRNVRLLLYGNIGNYFRFKKDYGTARRYYHKARDMAIADSNMDTYAAMAYELSVLFGRLGQTDSSYHYLAEYNDLISNVQQPQTVESYKNYVDMVMEASSNKIKLSEQAVIIKNKQLLILVIAISAIIVVAVLLLFILAERRRRMRQTLLLKEIENKELSDLLGHEQEIQRLQKEKVEQKMREISSYSLLLANKNNVLSTINAYCINGEPGQNLQKIRRLTEESLHTDGDYWQIFVSHFVQIHPDFFEKLKSRFPDLTANETKLCAYIRIGMTSKQIASMLNLSPESVNTNRYRIRKKHHLSKEEDLDEIIKGL